MDACATLLMGLSVGEIGSQAICPGFYSVVRHWFAVVFEVIVVQALSTASTRERYRKSRLNRKTNSSRGAVVKNA